jgi:hypothetical protein
LRSGAAPCHCSPAACRTSRGCSPSATAPGRPAASCWLWCGHGRGLLWLGGRGAVRVQRDGLGVPVGLEYTIRAVACVVG